MKELLTTIIDWTNKNKSFATATVIQTWGSSPRPIGSTMLVSEEMEMPVSDVLCTFGEWWILRTSKEKYGGLMEAGGNNLREFLVHLPMFHNRVMLIYPKLTPPEFKVSDIEEKSIHVHYFSKRLGLQDFVRGLLQGLGKMYRTPVVITLLETRDEGAHHEVFKVSWD